MSTYKFIYWRPDIKESSDGKMWANVHLLVGYNQCSIVDYQKMAEELRKTFPEATDDKVRCGKVTKSSYCQGFSIIAFDARIPKGEYPGWTQRENGQSQDYYW